MAINGFQLDLSDGTTFRCSADVDVRHNGQALYPVDGLRQFVAIYNNYIDDDGGQPGRSDSNYSGVFLGFGAGVHLMDVTFEQVANTTDAWGDATSGSSTAVELRDRLVRALTTIPIGSFNVGLLQVGEFSDSGIYNQIPVAAREWNVEVAVRDGDPSLTRGTIQFASAVDLEQAVDANARLG